MGCADSSLLLSGLILVPSLLTDGQAVSDQLHRSDTFRRCRGDVRLHQDGVDAIVDVYCCVHATDTAAWHLNGKASGR